MKFKTEIWFLASIATVVMSLIMFIINDMMSDNVSLTFMFGGMLMLGTTSLILSLIKMVRLH